jgi:hypothetical protein
MADINIKEWKNSPKLDDLKDDFSGALEYHDAQLLKFDEYEKILDGGPVPNVAKGRSKLRLKLARKQAEWRYASLEEPFLNTKDMFKIKPRTFEDTQSAEQNELVLNYQWTTKVDKVSLVNNIVRNLVNLGSVIVKTGWKLEEDVVITKETINVYADPDKSLTILQDKLDRGEITQEEYMSIMESGEPVKIGEEEKEYSTVIQVENCPEYTVCDLRDVIIDPTVDDIKDANFIIHRYEMSFSELKELEHQKIIEANGNEREVGIYRNLDKLEKTLRADEDDNEPLNSDEDIEHNEDVDFEFNDFARKKVDVYEYWGYWDINNNGIVVPIVATWVGNVMIRLEESPYPFKGLPFSMAKYMPKVNELYGEPDAELLKDNQDSINKMMRATHDITAQIAVNQKFIDSQFFDGPLQRKNYEEGKTVYFKHGMDPRISIHKESIENVPNAVFNVIQYHQNEAEAMTGIKSFSQGISGNALGSSATGIRSAMDATAKRELSILRRLASQIFEDIARKTIIMNQAFLNEEEVVRITNHQFVTIKREDLKGEFDLTVEVSTPEKDNEKAEKLNMLMQTNAANMDPNLAKIIYAKIAKLWKEPDLAEEMLNFKPEPNPMQEQLAKLQIENEMLKNQELKMRIAKVAKDIESEDSKIEERESRIAKHLSMESEEFKTQAQLNAAKARLIDSDAKIKAIQAKRLEQGIDIKSDLTKEKARIEGQKQIKLLEQEHKMELEKLKREIEMQREYLNALLEKEKIVAETQKHNAQLEAAKTDNARQSLNNINRIKGESNARI